MNPVECPKCTLRFEPDEYQLTARCAIFCPQCGHEFQAAPLTGGSNESAASQTA